MLLQKTVSQAKLTYPAYTAHASKKLLLPNSFIFIPQYLHVHIHTYIDLSTKIHTHIHTPIAV